MTINRNILDILKQNESRVVRKLDDEGLVWMIEESLLKKWLSRKDKALDIDKLKLEILKLIQDQHKPIIFHHDDPFEEDVPGAWNSVGDGCWRIPSGLNFDKKNTKFWIGLGGWMMYPSDSPINETIDTFRSKPEEVVQLLRREKLDVIIDSFHDNNPWLVCVASV